MPTGQCLIVVTPDAQRTMNTFLGVSSLLGPDDVSTEVAASGQVVYMEGYLYDRPEAKMAYRKAAEVALRQAQGVTHAVGLVLRRSPPDFLALVRDEVDLLFSNDDELAALYEVDDLDEAVRQVRRDCDIAGGDGRRRRFARRDRG